MSIYSLKELGSDRTISLAVDGLRVQTIDFNGELVTIDASELYALMEKLLDNIEELEGDIELLNAKVKEQKEDLRRAKNSFEAYREGMLNE